MKYHTHKHTHVHTQVMIISMLGYSDQTICSYPAKTYLRSDNVNRQIINSVVLCNGNTVPTMGGTRMNDFDVSDKHIITRVFCLLTYTRTGLSVATAKAWAHATNASSDLVRFLLPLLQYCHIMVFFCVCRGNDCNSTYSVSFSCTLTS